jgi:hypothetical protein
LHACAAHLPATTTHARTHAQGDIGVIRLLLRANARLLALAAAEPRLAAAADASSGLLDDVRGAADRYGKVAARLAWDMAR